MKEEDYNDPWLRFSLTEAGKVAPSDDLKSNIMNQIQALEVENNGVMTPLPISKRWSGSFWMFGTAFLIMISLVFVFIFTEKSFFSTVINRMQFQMDLSFLSHTVKHALPELIWAIAILTPLLLLGILDRYFSRKKQWKP